MAQRLRGRCCVGGVREQRRKNRQREAKLEFALCLGSCNFDFLPFGKDSLLPLSGGAGRAHEAGEGREGINSIQSKLLLH